MRCSGPRSGELLGGVERLWPWHKMGRLVELHPLGELGDWFAWGCKSNSKIFRISFKSYVITGSFIGDFSFIALTLDLFKNSAITLSFPVFALSIIYELSFSPPKFFGTPGPLCLFDWEKSVSLIIC